MLPNQTYSLVSDKESLEDPEQGYAQSQKPSYSITRILIIASLLSNAFLIAYMTYPSWQPRSSSAWSILGDTPTYPVQFHRFSNYSSSDGEDDQEMSMRWNNIDIGYGVVAVDHAWAAGKGLPPAQSLPSDDTKGIYVIDAYHSFHCLQEIRRSWYQLRDYHIKPIDEQEGTYLKPGHYSHCFDYLLRSIICNPSDHLFAHSEGLGEGQIRQCRDWRVLRDWASSHTACDPKDTENENSRRLHVSICHGKDDSVPHGINTA